MSHKIIDAINQLDTLMDMYYQHKFQQYNLPQYPDISSIIHHELPHPSRFKTYQLPCSSDKARKFYRRFKLACITFYQCSEETSDIN